jgi:D-3-phosphoglycerate dehydrogenase
VQRTIDEHRRRLESLGLKLVLPEIRGQQLSEAELLPLVPGISGIIAGDDVISRQVIERADALRIVSKWGVGTDNIDLVAAAEHGVKVSNTPGVFGDEVADVVIGYLILLARGLQTIDTEVRTGGWPKLVGFSLAGRTIGVIGLGDIGREVARRCVAMRMRVVGAEPDSTAAASAGTLGVELLPIDELLQRADIVSLNCPLTPKTHHLVDSSAFASMKRGVWLINTARGAIVNEPDLIAALRTGRVARAALDVFEEEPLPPDSPLRTLPNVILGSHNSSNTEEAVHRTSGRAIENLLEGLAV